MRERGGGGRGSSANCTICLPTTYPVIKEFGYISITRVVVVFFTLPSEFQVIIPGSKKQQQKDSYQSEVPFSVIPGRTP